MVFQRHRKYLFENINQLCGLKPRYLNKSTVFLLRKSKSSIHLELCVDHVDVTWHRHVLFTFSVKLAGEKKHAYNARGRGEGISAGDSDFNCTLIVMSNYLRSQSSMTHVINQQDISALD